MAHVCVGSTHFPFKVHMILERDFDCIQWCGPNCFRLVNADTFVKHVLPKFFKHEKLSSFTRQLNIYGFHKIREGPLKGAYTHEDFMRGDLERVSTIPRTKRSGPREVMKMRESRNASVMYSSMMMRKSGAGSTEDSDSSSSADESYTSDSSGTRTPPSPVFLEYKIAPAAPPSATDSLHKRKRRMSVEKRPDLFAILEKTRFSYKERSYNELKAETEQQRLAKKARHDDDDFVCSSSPEFEPDLSPADFSGDTFPTVPLQVFDTSNSDSRCLASVDEDENFFNCLLEGMEEDNVWDNQAPL